MRSLQAPQHPCPLLVIAHRGASGECPENTLAAFRRAIELGADMLECDKAFRGERLPTLEDVLSLAAGKVLLNIEIKRAVLHTHHTRSTAEKVAVLVARSGLQDTVLVSSFDPGALAHIKAYQPTIPTALVTMHRPRGGVPAVMQRLNLQALHVSRHRVSSTLMTEAHSVQCPVRAFTVDAIPEMRRLIADGVDGLFTNYPGRLRRLLATISLPA